MLERIFKLSENKTNVRTEIVAGITTFLTMAYIIFVNPAILGRPPRCRSARCSRRPAWPPPSAAS